MTVARPTLLWLLWLFLFAAPAADGDDKDPVRSGPPTSAAPVVRAGPSTVGLERTTEASLAAGLAWLARGQAREPDGSFPAGNVQAYPRVGATALAALALMAGGSTPGRGPYGHEVSRAIEYLLSKVDLDPGSARFGYISDSGDHKSRTHGHGLATLALTQAMTVSARSDLGARLAEAIEAAVLLIERTQGSEGAWHYEPQRTAQHEGSITITLVQALRAARNSGFKVDPAVIARALDYVKRSQSENGSFRYALGSDDTSVALTAAAISTMNATGTYRGAVVDDGYLYIFRELAGREALLDAGKQPDPLAFPYYERLYVAQAFWQHPDKSVFESWFEAEARRMVAIQGEDGSWRDPRFGDVYATATNCLVLALRDAWLPIFQR